MLDPVYRTELKHVWLFDDVPAQVRHELNLPDTDQGIDLIAETKEGTYWAIQCKYRQDETKPLTWREISTFTGLAFGISSRITYGLICTTGERYPKLLRNSERIGVISSDTWHALGAEFFDQARALLAEKPTPLAPRNPRPHQARAIANAAAYFEHAENRRGKLIMPCGSGKSLTAFWIAERLGAETILVAVPSLYLLRQTLHDWLRELTALGRAEEVRWLCVCSDKTVGETRGDDVAVLAQDLGVPCVTDPAAVATWLATLPGHGLRIVFTTYQSGPVVAAAARESKVHFDLGIFDEAHKTVGQKEKRFSHLLFDEHISIARRVFMTATERRYAGSSDTIVSMEDPAHFGETFELLTFKDALAAQPPILADYQVLTMVVPYEEVAELIERNLYVRPDTGGWDEEVEAQQLAALVALRKAMQLRPIRHAISFHSSIARAAAFARNSQRLAASFPEFGALDSFHVTGAMPTSVRERELREFTRAPRALMTNARCLTEGVDVPGIDCVLFADPKQSIIDIVQASGRALRPAPGKERGYVIVPVLAKSADANVLLEGGAFSHVLTVLRALAANDERIVEYFQGIQQGRRSRGGVIELEIDERIAQAIDVEKFIKQIELIEWKRIARLSWSSYDEAIIFVHNLNLTGQTGWFAYCRGERPDLPHRPYNIPTNPWKVYGTEFIAKGGWGGWLGTKYVATYKRNYLPFREAIAFVHALHLSHRRDWEGYCRGERKDLPQKPDTIPYSPWHVYGAEFTAAGGWGGWLGTGTIAGKNRSYWSYKKASDFSKSLGLKNRNEWVSYYNTHAKKLVHIPKQPERVYGEEFLQNGGWGGWLGTGYVATFNRKHLPYDEAIKFVHSLKIKSEPEWRTYCKGKMPNQSEKPINIPAAPLIVYKDEFIQKGGWGGWLGKGGIARRLRKKQPYKNALEFARSLHLKNREEWRAYCSGEFPNLPAKPVDIPIWPNDVYGDEFRQGGGWGGWLGTNFIATFKREFLPYTEAVAFVRALKLSNDRDWNAYCRGERPDLPHRPYNIPTNPWKVYDAEFKAGGGLGGWLGTGNRRGGQRRGKVSRPTDRLKKL